MKTSDWEIPEYVGELPKCPKCGHAMTYSYIFSDFKCDNCGETIDENDADVEVVLEWADDDVLEWGNDETNGDIPFCCIACGGPYPQCTTSCKIFDD